MEKYKGVGAKKLINARGGSEDKKYKWTLILSPFDFAKLVKLEKSKTDSHYWKNILDIARDFTSSEGPSHSVS